MFLALACSFDSLSAGFGFWRRDGSSHLMKHWAKVSGLLRDGVPGPGTWSYSASQRAGTELTVSATGQDVGALTDGPVGEEFVVPVGSMDAAVLVWEEVGRARTALGSCLDRAFIVVGPRDEIRKVPIVAEEVVIVDAGKIVEGWEAKEVIVEGKLLLDAGEEVVVGDATRRRGPRTKHRGRQRRRTKWVVHVCQGGVLLEERRHAGQ